MKSSIIPMLQALADAVVAALEVGDAVAARMGTKALAIVLAELGASTWTG